MKLKLDDDGGVLPNVRAPHDVTLLSDVTEDSRQFCTMQPATKIGHSTVFGLIFDKMEPNRSTLKITN